MNYYGAWRTNYFQVKDPDAFRAFCERWRGVYVSERKKIVDHEGETLYGCGVDLAENDSGVLPYEIKLPDHPDAIDGWVYANELTPPDETPDFIEELGEQLADGWVAIVMWGGREGLRYIDGGAIAVNSEGEIESITLDDIYDLAITMGSVKPTRCQF